MKKTIITLAALLAAAASYAQGTVNFTTKSGTAVDALVKYELSAGGATSNADGNFWGQLFWSAPGANSWTAIGAPTPFRTGSGQGYITAGAQTTTAAAGATVDIQFRGWASSKVAGGSDAGFGPGKGAYYNNSVLPNVTLGGGGSPPATPTLLTGLSGFTIAVPEPSLAALGLLGAGLLLIRRKK